MTPWARRLCRAVVYLLETLRLYPRGTCDAMTTLAYCVDSVVEGGREGIFSPCWWFVGRNGNGNGNGEGEEEVREGGSGEVGSERVDGDGGGSVDREVGDGSGEQGGEAIEVVNGDTGIRSRSRSPSKARNRGGKK